jgi:Domain of unknown function (DUF6438)
MVRALSALLFVFALSACATAPTAPPATAPAAPLAEAASITLFEGGCFYYSSCTTYEITVRPDGGYRLNGQSLARTQGWSEGNIGAAAFAAAEAALAGAHFSSLPERMNGSDTSVWRPDAYPCMNHAPGVRITRRTSDGQQKDVFWDVGCRSAAMSNLLGQMREAFRYDELVAPVN